MPIIQEKKYRWCIILATPNLGGAEKQALFFAKYLQDKGQDVLILTLIGGDGVLKDLCNAKRIRIESLEKKKITNIFKILQIFKFDKILGNLSYIQSLSKYLNNNNIDICIAYTALPCVALAFTRFFVRKCIYRVWFQRDLGYTNYSNAITRRALLCSNLILSNSKICKEYLNNEFKIDSEIIYNVFLPEKCLYSIQWWNEKVQLNSNNTFVAIMIANLTQVKDHLTLLKAWKIVTQKLKSQNKETILLLAGRLDSETTNIRNYILNEKLDNSVRLLGSVDDIQGILKIVDVCVFSSNKEGSPNGIIETEFASLPVVATDIPAIREVIPEENHKFLVSPGDFHDFANKILYLEEHNQERKLIGEINYNFVYKLFNYDTNFNKLYNGIIKRMKQNNI